MTTPLAPNTDERPEPTLGAFLHEVSQKWSDGQAAVLCAVGVLATAGILVFASRYARYALASGALAALGAWIVMERSVQAPAWMRVLQRLTAGAGVLAAFGFALSLLMSALGIWIS